MRKIFSILFTILFVFPLIFSTLVIYPLSVWALDRDFYIETLSSEELQAVIFSDENLGIILTENFSEAGSIDLSVLHPLIQTLISEQFYKNQVSSIINQVFDFLDGESASLSLQIDLGEIKDAFNGPNQQVLLEELAKGIPICLDAQTTQEMEFTLCKPVSISDEEFIEDYLKPSLPLLLMGIPNKVTISEPIRRNELIQGIPAFFQPYLTVSGLKTAILILAAVTILLWLLTALIAGSNRRERLLWLGWTLFLPSLIVLLGFITNQILPWDLVRYRIEQIGIFDTANLPTLIIAAIQSLQTLFVEKINSSFIPISVVCSSIGLGLIAWGAALSKDHN